MPSQMLNPIFKTGDFLMLCEMLERVLSFGRISGGYLNTLLIHWNTR